jgi:hypothetical protein
VSIRGFLREIDAAWTWPRTAKIPLRIIDAGALLLQTDYARGTKDSDVLESSEIDDETQRRLITLGGAASDIFRRRKMFLEFVPRGLPFLPQAPHWTEPAEMNELLSHFRVEVLDVVDVVVSKLSRFHADDISDIEAMIDKGLVPHSRLVARFESAMDVHLHGADAERTLKCIKCLNQVERDMLFVPETRPDLPAWFTDRFE